MKKLSFESMEKISGGSIWTDLACTAGGLVVGFATNDFSNMFIGAARCALTFD
jgi:hypothetical protein